MKSINVAAFATLIFFGIAAPVEAATLYSNDTFDPATGLWTYNYIVDDTSGGAAITEVSILINGGGFPTRPVGYFVVQPIPAPYTAPSGWTMHGAFSGSIAGPPYNELGGFYEFYSGGFYFNNPGNSILSGQIVSGFSVTTPFAPTAADGANDYFLYGCTPTSGPYPTCDVQAYGNVVVPSGADWLQEQYSYPTSTPLPSTLPLLLTGLGALGLPLLRRKRKAQAAA